MWLKRPGYTGFAGRERHRNEMSVFLVRLRVKSQSWEASLEIRRQEAGLH